MECFISLLRKQGREGERESERIVVPATFNFLRTSSEKEVGRHKDCYSLSLMSEKITRV